LAQVALAFLVAPQMEGTAAILFLDQSHLSVAEAARGMLQLAAEQPHLAALAAAVALKTVLAALAHLVKDTPGVMVTAGVQTIPAEEEVALEQLVRHLQRQIQERLVLVVLVCNPTLTAIITTTLAAEVVAATSLETVVETAD
jgi:hypothetical protein